MNADGGSPSDIAVPIRSVSPTPSPTVEPTPTLADALAQYLSDIDGIVRDQWSNAVWEWNGGGSHRGKLFGPLIAVEYDSDGPARWLSEASDTKAISAWFYQASLELAEVQAPPGMVAAHTKFMYAFRMEARRWSRFVSVQRASEATRWEALKRWESWSKSAFAKQCGLLRDWVFSLRLSLRRERVAWPLCPTSPYYQGLRWYVNKVQALVD
jgi:hypothetical protein